MKPHTQGFKDAIKQMGRELNGIITYDEITLDEEIMSITPHYEANLLKSVMKQLDLELSVDIPLETIINCQIGIYVDNDYEMLDFGNYVVYSSEKQEDTGTYKIVCYDKLLYSMKQNEDLEILYPISIKNYLSALANKIGLSVAQGTFYNESLEIPSELYLGTDYTYRDILDEIAQATGSIICLNENDEIVVKYPTATGDTIDEEFLKDTNVDFAQAYGPINSIVLSRAGESDNVYIQDSESVQENGLCEVKIVDNQIMNFNNRSDYLQGLLAALDGLYYHINDFNSTGIMYYEVGDLYDIQIGENTYQCIMLNDEINVTTGIEELIHTNMPEQSETDYSKADKTDRKINQTYIIVDKQNQTINSVVSTVEGQNSKISQLTQTVGELNSKIQDIADITIAGESDAALVPLTNVNESEPIMLKVHPTVENISYLYPTRAESGIGTSNALYPSNTLYLKNRIINFKRTYEEEGQTIVEDIPYELPDDLLRYNSNIYDEFYLDYDTHTCQITKRCEYIGGNNNLANPEWVVKNSTVSSQNVSYDDSEKITVSIESTTVAIFFSCAERIKLTEGGLSLRFSNLENIQMSNILINVDYYNEQGQRISSKPFYDGVATITSNDVSPQASSCVLNFQLEVGEEHSDMDFSFKMMLNYGTTPLQFEPYYAHIQPKAQEQVIDYEYPSIYLGDGDYEVSIVGYDYGYIQARLMAKNIYTSQFATQAQMTSAISQKADEIDLSVNQKLTAYSTTNEMNSAINIKADQITSTVSQTYTTKNETSEVTSALSTRIKQTAKSIELTANDNGTSAGIVIRMRNEDGTQIDSDSANITMSGLVKFTDLSRSGSTTINGSNITTGTIDASQVTVKNINADKITSGTLSASKISGGTLDCSNITVKKLSANDITTGTLNGVPVKNTSISGTSMSGGSISGSSISNSGYNFNGNDNDNLVIKKGSSTLEGYYGSTGSSSNRRYALAAQNPRWCTSNV